MRTAFDPQFPYAPPEPVYDVVHSQSLGEWSIAGLQVERCVPGNSLLLCRRSADLQDMPEWSEDLSQRTLDEIVGLKEENRAWQRELRTRAVALVNSRLAKQISPEEYAAKREAAKTDADECKRRTALLTRQAWSRRGERRTLFVPAL